MNDTLTTIHSSIQNNIEYILGLPDMSTEEQEQFMEAVGVLVIESAVLKFIVSIMPGEREAFELWLEAHRQDNDLLERSLETYPLFAEILTEEINAFQSEAKCLFGIHE
jgi:hypothetical protein